MPSIESKQRAKSSRSAQPKKNKKVQPVRKELNKKELQLKKIDGTVVWTRKGEEMKELKTEDNKLAVELQTQFESLIKQCHRILYNNGAIVGKKAMDDIMKILTLKLLQPLFRDGQILKAKYDRLYEDEKSEVMRKKLTTSYEQCIGFDQLIIHANPANEWKNLVNNMLSKIIRNIYGEKDNTFNAGKKPIQLIIERINTCDVFDKLTKEKDGIRYYDSISGGIYEYFMLGYSGNDGASDVLGQHFTPRPMIDLMVYGLELSKHVTTIDDNTTIYDPCTGSGGFLTRLFNCFPTIKPSNIYGGEVEKDTMKICISNLLLTTGTFCENLVNQNSVVYEDEVKHDIIMTNPPFGTSMQYGWHKVKEGERTVDKDGLEQEYDREQEKKQEKKRKEQEKTGSANIEFEKIEFKTIYPIHTNDGACLFTQKCVYKLKPDGVLSIVLPDGQLFFGKNFRKFREWLSEQINILYIVQAPSGTFNHAGIKTCVIMAKKNGPTQQIQFLKTDKMCGRLERIVTIDAEDMALGDYSFDPKDYLEDVYLSKMMDGSGVEWKLLGDLCEIKSGDFLSKQNMKVGDYNVIGGGKIIGKHNTYNREGGEFVITRVGDININWIDDKYFLTDNGLFINMIQNKNKYIYHFFNNNQVLLKKMYKGSSQKVISSNSLKQFRIPLPSLDIQLKIVVELDQLEEHVRTLKQLMEHTKKAKEMYSSYGMIREIRELLKGCEVMIIGNVCDFRKGKNLLTKDFKKGIYQVIGGGKTPSGHHNEYNRDENTILCSSSGSYAGYISKYDNKIWATDCFSIESNNDNLNEIYLYYYLVNIQDTIYRLQTGMGQPHVYSSSFNNLKIPLPSLSIQQQCIEVYQKKEIRLKEYDDEMERIGNQIKQCQEMGRQVIEYYITADEQPMDMDREDGEPEDDMDVNERDDGDHTDDREDDQTDDSVKKKVATVAKKSKPSIAVVGGDPDDQPKKKIPMTVKKTKPIDRCSDGDDEEETDVPPKKKTVSDVKKPKPSIEPVRKDDQKIVKKTVVIVRKSDSKIQGLKKVVRKNTN